MPASNARHIIVLDDDPGILSLIASAAELSGFSAHTTVDPDDFFLSLEKIKPAMVIIDLIMPKQDGIEILQRLARQPGPHPHLIIASGAGSRVLDAARQVADELGLNVAGVLTKPFRASSIRQLLSQGDRTDQSVRSLTQREPAPELLAHSFKPDEVFTAIKNKQLVVYFQPKICCKSGNLRGFEALVRWQHPDLGIVLPDSFVGIAESAGYIWQLTQVVVHQSLAFLASLDHNNLNISINLSPRLLDREDVVGLLSEACEKFNIAAERVIVELTESSTSDNKIMALNMLTRMRVKGFRLSIDDFGVGFSSLVQLARLPFSEIKIDKSFVQRLGHSDEASKIVRTIVALGEGLGLEVVAEGVETLDQLQLLSAFGCDTVQGFYIGHPMPNETMCNWIANYQPTELFS